ncbi:MAG: TonB-dependent receptor [Verrucomicrobia bacterium]|nr:TonB-dependent receptor [Verrucomicrobiota bacterium]
MTPRPDPSALLFLLALSLVPLALRAQPATGTVSGRVFNPATGEYVRNAEVTATGTDLSTFTADDGSFSLSNVPAGTVTVRVAYTGYETATAQLNLTAGLIATRDFTLTPAGVTSAAAASSASGVVKLQQFVVSSEREGNAKAIMDQRAAINIKNVIASDNFGDITNGNVGEFIKYMPGVVIDYNQSDARAVRIGGLDPKYVGVSVDGMRLASAQGAAFGADSRQFEFEQSSINSVETIELNKTLTARMDADSPAGAINLRSRSAFDRKGREVVAQFTASANEYRLTLARVPSPTNALRRVIFPGATLSYSEVFAGKFGVQLNLGSSTIYGEQEQITHAYDFTNATTGPRLTGLTFKDAPKIIERASLGANFDYKITPRLVASLRITGSFLSDEFVARNIAFTANIAQIDPSSTLTRVVANATTNANTRLETTGNHRNKRNVTVTYVPKLEYHRGDLTLTASGGYSRSGTHYEDLRQGYFQSINLRLTRLSWRAERASTNSTEWTVTQLAGRPWGDIASWGRDDANANNLISTARGGQSQVFVGNLDAKSSVTVAGLPVQLLAGLKARLTTFDITWGGTQNWTFVGPRGSQTDPATVMIDESQHPYDPKRGGNITQQGLPWPDSNAMASYFFANPTQFTPNTVTNFTNAATTPRSVKEQIDAAYLEANSRWRQVRFNLGARFERTRTIGRTYDILPAAAVRAAGYTAGTIPYVAYQYRNFTRPSTYGGYDNLFFSGGAKYSFTRNLVFQVAASQSIGRPNYDSLAGVIAVNDTTQRVTLPNPNLKPETSDKYFVSAQYYLEPAGTLTLSAYRLFVKNLGISTELVSAAEAGYADDPEYNGYTFARNANASGRRRLQGLDLEYSQQLVFLPGVWRGFSVFGSVSRTVPDIQLVDIMSKSANGGLRYGNHRFNAQVRFTWTAARITGITAARTQWERERLMFDFSGGYKINRTYELTLSCRNVFNQALESYFNVPGTIAYKDNFGAVWTLGVRARW